MSERNPFQQNQKGPLQCEEWEALLVDALDGTLRAEDSAVFATHGKDCPMCAEMLAQAKQGQEWMRFLQEEPPVPVHVMAPTGRLGVPKVRAFVDFAVPRLRTCFARLALDALENPVGTQTEVRTAVTMRGVAVPPLRNTVFPRIQPMSRRPRAEFMTVA